MHLIPIEYQIPPMFKMRDAEEGLGRAREIVLIVWRKCDFVKGVWGVDELEER